MSPCFSAARWLGPAAHLELVEDVVHVQLDRTLGDEEFAGDLLVAEARREEAQDLGLPSSETTTAQAVNELGRDWGAIHL
jgi:hypothetical protein